MFIRYCLLIQCVNADPPWSRHQGEIIHEKDSLGETPVKDVREKKQKKARRILNWWYGPNTCVKREGRKYWVGTVPDQSTFLRKSLMAKWSFQAKLPIKGISCWTGMGWHYSIICFSSILDRNEPAMLIHWLWAVQGEHGLSIFGAATRSWQSTMPP